MIFDAIMQEEAGLFEAASSVLHNAHAPYTGRRAGVAIRLGDGRVFTGCNFENPAFFHGFESLETAVGRMIVESGWTATGVLPEIAEVFFCFDAPWEIAGTTMPGPLGLSLLKIFAKPSARIYYAVQGAGVFEAQVWDDIAERLPPPDFDKAAFGKRAQERQAKALTVTPHDEKQQGLYRARLQACDPISNYAVGVKIDTACGREFYGCNIEVGGNKALHAESVAISGMVAGLGPQARIARITILTGGIPGFPCGGCRQHINEFALPETVVVTTNIKGERQETRHAELLPHSFGGAALVSGQKA